MIILYFYNLILVNKMIKKYIKIKTEKKLKNTFNMGKC
jgi:hypothetical protein